MMIAACNGIAVAAEAAPKPAQMLRTVARVYQANRSAFTSMQCDYVLMINNVERRCRYARQGDCLHHASIDLLPTGARSFPREMAYDGQVIMRRPNPAYMYRSRDVTKATPSCPTPESAINDYLEQALGYVPRDDQQYEVVSAEIVEFLGDECVELSFAAKWLGGRLVSRHTKSKGYAPVSVELFDHTGKRVYHLRDARYAELAIDGNILYYPTHFATESWIEGATAANVLVYDVEPSTLKVNELIPRSRFRLDPWPNEHVYDLETGASERTKDPTWSPIGKVGFPYDVFYSGMAGGGTVATAGRVAGESVSQEGHSLKMRTDSWAWWFLLAAGAGCVLLGVYAKYRSRLKAT
jgi:hypothetical protein